MSFDAYAIARPLLFALGPEATHELALDALEALQRTPAIRLLREPRIDDPVTIAGLHFPNRIGLAAGFDKNGRCIDGFGAMGFGFVEVGTVTPLAQPGNPRPRMFRLTRDRALVNRLGFNNEGLAAVVANLRRSVRFRAGGGVLGINIGKNAATPIERAADDYLAALEGVYPHADYVTVNVSSPNTKDLRTLQNDVALSALLAALVDRRSRLADAHGRHVPIFVKVAPDLDDPQVASIATVLVRHRLDGVVATNTTVARDGVRGRAHAGEAGGLSGAPLLEPSNRIVRALRAALGASFPIVGVGGVTSGIDALSKRSAGADLVQIYTGLIYRGPALVGEAAAALRDGGASTTH